MKLMRFIFYLGISLLKLSIPILIFYFLFVFFKLVSKWFVSLFLDVDTTLGKWIWIGGLIIAGFSFLMFIIALIMQDMEKRYDKRNKKISEEQWKVYFESRPEQRIKHVIEKHPGESHAILQKHAESLFEKIKPSSSLSSAWNEENQLIPEIKLNNEETFLHLEKELEAIRKYDTNSIKAKILYATKMYPVSEEVQILPTEPIKHILNDIGLTKSALDRDMDRINVFQHLITEATTYIEKEIAIIASGLGGERRMNEELSLYDYVWNHFSNVRFEVNGQSVETDNLIVSTRGVYSIEVKNYAQKGNYSLHLTKDGQWLKVFPNGNDEPMEKNITSQVNRHIAFKQKLINEEMRKKQGDTATFIPLQPIVVIANDTVRIQNDSDLPVLRISQVYHHIMKQPEILSVEQVEQISKIIKDNQLPVKKYPVKSYVSTLDTIYNSLVDAESRISKTMDMMPRFINDSNEELLRLEAKYNPK